MNFNKILVLGLCLLYTTGYVFAGDTIVYHLNGQLTPKDSRITFYSGFNVPANAKRIEVTQKFTAADGKKCAIDLGLFDEKGYDLNTPGFRGWSGGSRRFFFIEQDTATPGYRPGPILPGKWHVVQMLTSKNPEIDWELTIKVLLFSKPVKANMAKPIAYKGKMAATVLHPKDGKPTGRYYKIDTHVHSVHSDGKLTLAELVAMGKKNGLDGIVSTDHNTTSALREWGKVQDSAFIVLNGMESTYTQGHWNVINMDPDHWVDFRVHMNDVESFKKVLAHAHFKQGITIANHPFAIRFMYDATLMDGIEVWNGKWNANTEKSLELWHNLLCAGKKSIATAATDFHNSKSLGSPCSAIWGDQMSSKSLIDHIRNGNLYLVQDPSVDMSFRGYFKRNPEVSFVMGSTVILKEKLFVDFSSNRAGLLRVVNQDGEIAQQQIVAGETYSFEVPGRSMFVRTELRDSDNKMIAMSNPIYVVPFSNQFPLISKE